MQKAALATIALLLCVQAAAAEGIQLQAATPGRFESPTTETDSAQWLLIVFHDDAAAFEVPFTSQALLVNETYLHPMKVDSSNGGFDFDQETRSTQEIPAAEQLTLTIVGKSAVYIEADSISLLSTSVGGQLAEKEDGGYITAFSRKQDLDERLHREFKPAGDHAVLTFEPESNATFQLQATAIRHVEWYGVDVACKLMDPCPGGGGTETVQVAQASIYNVTSEQDSYEFVQGGIAELSGAGAFDYAVVGGQALQLDLRPGSVRLPLATGETVCAECLAPDGQTLAVSGNLSLQGLQMAPGGGLAMKLDGEFTSARFDEATIDPGLLNGKVAIATVAAATAAGLVILKFLLAPLFTRLSKDEALEHPRRRAIFEHIQRNPGTSFRETARIVGIAAGTVRHHLNILQRAGMVVERPHGATVRFFENLGKDDSDWVEVVMLREPALKLLFEWLKGHPRSSQTAILEAMEAHGWSRSTTQHRLSRLVDAALVTIRLQGRYKIYSVADRPPSSGDGRPNPMAPTPNA